MNGPIFLNTELIERIKSTLNYSRRISIYLALVYLVNKRINILDYTVIIYLISSWHHSFERKLCLCRNWYYLTQFSFFSMDFVGFTVFCSALGTQGSAVTIATGLTGVTVGPAGQASTEGLQSLLSNDDELEINEEHSGRENKNFSHGRTRKASRALLLLNL